MSFAEWYQNRLHTPAEAKQQNKSRLPVGRSVLRAQLVWLKSNQHHHRSTKVSSVCLFLSGSKQQPPTDMLTAPSAKRVEQQGQNARRTSGCNGPSFCKRASLDWIEWRKSRSDTWPLLPPETRLDEEYIILWWTFIVASRKRCVLVDYVSLFVPLPVCVLRWI